MPPVSGSLAGLNVLDLSRMLPGPYCSMVLADHGAEVIAIEDRRFAADNLFFPGLYRNKKHLCLNIKDPEGRKIFLRLVEEADVVIEGFRPGVVQRLGIDYETLQRIRPDIIYCSITGYGQTGPYSQRAGHDVNYLSVSGLLDLIGPADGPPTIPGVQIADIAGGGQQAVTGILLALLARARTGKGQYIDISMTDGLFGLLALPHELSKRSGSAPRRSDDLLSHRFACYNVYRTADHRYLAVGALESRFWKQLCTVLDLPDYADRQYDDDCREELIALLRETIGSRTAAQWEELLAGHDVCCTTVTRFDEIFSHPLFGEREMIVTVVDGVGQPQQLLGIPVKLSETPGSIRRPPDSFGGSSQQILMDLGYVAEQVEDLRRRGVI
jgi:crotonobetainyl-CoA:carnitine CoA-transferase CaiB-like acyl-CoA transferase